MKTLDEQAKELGGFLVCPSCNGERTQGHKYLDGWWRKIFTCTKCGKIERWKFENDRIIIVNMEKDELTGWLEKWRNFIVSSSISYNWDMHDETAFKELKDLIKNYYLKTRPDASPSSIKQAKMEME